MAAPAKQSSRWGSLLQQALDGVESRLDNILVGDGPLESASATAAVTDSSSVKPEPGPARTSSNTNSTNDRLQERLARAIAAKKFTGQRPENSGSSSVTPSRVESPLLLAETPRRSLDAVSTGSEGLSETPKRNESVDETVPIQGSESEEQGTLSDARIRGAVNGVSSRAANEQSPRPSIESNLSAAKRPSTDLPQHDAFIANIMTLDDGNTLESLITAGNSAIGPDQLLDLHLSDIQRQEELHGYIERIDALQAKLQYLSRESAESARKATAAASPNSAERKLAEKDEQIALLMQEGQKLSKTELKHLTVIKKLRAKAAETEKETLEVKRRLEKADKEKASISDQLRRAEAAERQSAEKQKQLVQIQKDLEVITAERDVKNSTIVDLKAQLSDSMSQAKARELKAAQDILALEKGRVAELENDISSLKIEKELAAGRAKAQIDELRAKIEREAQRANVAELEMRAEQQMLESRLEVMRTRAEEVSSGATGDAQAKLLRQIETLQSQYAVASENWQGIETSLTARAINLEKERDEALKRETEVRRKAREVALKAKRNDEELEDTRTELHAFQAEWTGEREQLISLQRRAEEAELALTEAQNALTQERQIWRTEMQRLDDDKTRTREDIASHSPVVPVRAESPASWSHRSLTADLLGLQNLQTRTAARSLTNDLPIVESRASRKSSVQRVRSSGQATPQRQDSAQSFENCRISEPPSINTIDHDEYFEHVRSPSPTHQTMHDVLSVSTVGAGPSVQLVERMSAAVRRLESEKVSTREEIKRLAGQRDEARAQIVTLMQEAKSKRDIDVRLQKLEEENKKITARYQTTLEMLGEKSELVEELRADVQDVKDMYRELVERTVK